MLNKVFWLMLAVLLCSCTTTNTPQKQEDIKEEIKEVYSGAYPLFLQARLGSLNVNIMKEACDQGVKAACEDASFLHDRNQVELDQLCAKGMAYACYKAGEGFLYAPLGDILMPDSLQGAQFHQALIRMQKSCELGYVKACAVQGALLLNDDPQQAFMYFMRSCEANSMMGCHALYMASKNLPFKSPQDQQKVQRYAYAKMLDFGMDNILCEDISCLITGELAHANTIQQECQKGSGLACVVLAHQFKRDNKEAYLTQIATQNQWMGILQPHCFERQYVPACQALMELYFVRKNGDGWGNAGQIACESDFYARGMVRYERESQICTRVGDIFLNGVYVVGKEVLTIPKDKDRALYLYKIGCERGNEGRACNKLEKIIKENAHLVVP